MIPVESLLYELDQMLNNLASNFHQSIPEEDKIIVLNNSQNILIKQKLDTTNIHRIGLDGNKKRYEDLERLVENYEDHELTIVETDSSLNKWTVDLTDISPKYMFYVDSYMIASKGKCLDKIVYVNNDFIKHSDITTLLNNSNYKPSFEYQETFNASGTDELWYFTDGTFTPSKIFLSYIRYPQYICTAGFELPDGTIIENKQDCELNEYLKDELLDIAVRNIAMYTQNQLAVQDSDARIRTNE